MPGTAGPRLSPSGNSAGEGAVIPEMPQDPTPVGASAAPAALQAPRATCSPHAQNLGWDFLPAALSPPSWNAQKAAGTRALLCPGASGTAACPGCCQHCQKPDRHPSTEQWKSELIYLRKKTPKLVKRRRRHRLQALEALVRTTPRNQLYTTDRGAAEGSTPTPSPAQALPAQG